MNSSYGIFPSRGSLPKPNPESAYFEDETLCYRIGQDDEKAMQKAYKECESLAKMIVVRLGRGTATDAEDVSQEASVELWKAIKEGKIPPLTSKFTTWLNVVIKNEWQMLIRKEKRKAHNEPIFGQLVQLFGERIWTDEDLEKVAAIRERVFSTVKNPKHYRILHLRYGLGWKVADIADEGDTYGGVRTISVKLSEEMSRLRIIFLQELKHEGLI